MSCSRISLMDKMFQNKTNNVDFHWYVIRTLPHQENKVKVILETEQSENSNILEIFCPMNRMVRVMRNGQEVKIPYFANYVFVLTTEFAVKKLIATKYPDGYLVYDKCEGKVMEIPENQMRMFMDFNVNYPEDVLVLERPYSDYAFNPKNNQPNDAVIVTDGPFKGIVGYFVRFRGNRRLVFQMKNYKAEGKRRNSMDLVLSIPDIWDYPIRRLYHARQDKLSLATKYSRVIDYFLGKMQTYGIIDEAWTKFSSLMEELIDHPSLVDYCKKEKDSDFRNVIKQLSPCEATELMTLVEFLKSGNQWNYDGWEHEVIRPFLTNTAFGGPMDEEYKEIQHKDYVEVVYKLNFAEPTYFSDTNETRDNQVTYYAHVGIVDMGQGKLILFVDWTQMLDAYYLMDGSALDKQNNTFRTYCPTLYQVLSNELEVVALKNMKIGNKTLHVLGIEVDNVSRSDKGWMADSKVKENVGKLVNTGYSICAEINGSTHLAMWRRYLRTVWLHI